MISCCSPIFESVGCCRKCDFFLDLDSASDFYTFAIQPVIMLDLVNERSRAVCEKKYIQNSVRRGIEKIESGPLELFFVTATVKQLAEDQSIQL